MMLVKPIALVGLMGSGKSAVAPWLAARLALPWTDLDAEVERAAGDDVAALFARQGEAWFRERETAALEAAIRIPQVIACGGGVVVLERNRRVLRECCRTVWLEVSAATAAERVTAQGPARRPLLAGGPVMPRLAELLREREPWFAEVAALRVSSEGADLAAIAEAIVRAAGESAA